MGHQDRGMPADALRPGAPSRDRVQHRRRRCRGGFTRALSRRCWRCSFFFPASFVVAKMVEGWGRSDAGRVT
eukprot:3868984-Rhodomonas_salina.2